MKPFVPLMIALAACASSTTPAPTPAGAAAAGARSYGEAMPEGQPVPLEAVLADPDAHADRTVIVDGEVRAVCQTKGCWMELVTADGEACRVMMKGHAFFVPRDSSGSRARVAGEVKVKTIGVAEVEHMEAEGGSFARKMPDGTAREVRIVASAVELESGR